MAERTLQHLVDLLIPALNGVRQRRKYIENEWLEYYRAWQGWPTPEYMSRQPNNTIHYFTPQVRKAVERNVKRGVKLLMPNMEWLQTLPNDGRSHENAEAVQSTLFYLFSKKIPTKRNISSLLRCAQLYNFAGWETSVIIDNKEVWPYVRAFDPYNFYIFPDTAANLQEAVLVFEDSIIPYQVYKSYSDVDDERKRIYKNIDPEDLTAPLWPYHLIERIAYQGLTNPSDFLMHDGNTIQLFQERINERREEARKAHNSTKNFVSLTRCYFRVGSEWNFVVFCNNFKPSGNIQSNSDDRYSVGVVRLDDTERKPMYEWMNTRPLPGEAYSPSPVADIKVLQNLFNAALSQVESNRAIFAEPPMAMDLTHIGRVSNMTFGNRKIWGTDGPPKDIIQELNAQNTMADGLKAISLYQSMIDSSSGGGLPEGKPGRNAPRAGFSMNTLLNMSLTDIEDDADTGEQEVLTPTIGHVYHCILEYVPNSQLIKIPNKNPQLIKAFKRRDLQGDFSFSWLGSLGFQDTQVRADKFMQFLQTLISPQVFQIVVQELAAQKKKLDIVGLLKTMYSYGMGERGLGDIVIDMTEEDIQRASQPSPEQQQMQQEMEMQQQELQGNMQMKQTEMQMKAAENQQKMQMEQQKHQLSMQELQMKTQATGQQLAMKGQAEQQKLALEQHKVQLEGQRSQMEHRSQLTGIALKDKEQQMNAKYKEQQLKSKGKEKVGGKK